MKDADGKQISIGSVLMCNDKTCRGVVTRIVQAGQMGTVFDQVGDLNIQYDNGCYRVTNRYMDWHHIPHNEQTYAERLLSWRSKPFIYDDECRMLKDEAVAVDGIMSLLPDIVDWTYGPFPDSIEDALNFLMKHLEEGRWGLANQFDLASYIARQREWSEKTFGHSVRTNGITKHIEKELDEIRAAPHDLMEWIDVVILALDGAWRAGYTPEDITRALEQKQVRNFARQWPPAKDCDPDKPSEHIRKETEQC